MSRELIHPAGDFARTWRHAFCLLAPLCLFTLTAAAGPEKPPAAPVEVRLSEYAVGMPQTLPAGPAAFHVRNEGHKSHSFRIEGPGIVDSPATILKPGETSDFQVTLQPGEYKVYCPIGSHAAKGMTMKLVVH
ncbi:MAG TPA: cupredoxin domain-containing protein [Thermoanaerobaculia bacterium]|jgi:hypothetical protein|nr:cupredoxin domain-containing protein [Thermoanaerobaculia bacterium]